MSYAIDIVIGVSKMCQNVSGWRAVLSYPLPAILYAIGIFCVSSIPDLHGPELPVIPFDKAAHILEYAAFSVLVTRATLHYLHRFSKWTGYLAAWFTVAAFAALDELYQSIVPGRTPDVVDFLADICGGGLAILLIWWWHRRKAAP